MQRFPRRPEASPFSSALALESEAKRKPRFSLPVSQMPEEPFSKAA
jgi:hypothetical protein